MFLVVGRSEPTAMMETQKHLMKLVNAGMEGYTVYVKGSASGEVLVDVKQLH